MPTLVLIDVHDGAMDTVEGRLRARREIQATQRRGTGEPGLALLVDLDDAEDLTRFLDNQVQLTPGVRGYRVVQNADPHAVSHMAKA